MPDYGRDMTTLATIIYGSRLRGYARPDSDVDMAVLTDSCRARKRIENGEDVLYLPVLELGERLWAGDPMIAEIVASPLKTWTAEGCAWRPYVESLVPSASTFVSKSLDTSSALFKEWFKSGKRQRGFAALIMMANAADFLHNGVVRPRYTPEEIEVVSAVLDLVDEDNFGDIPMMDLLEWIGRS